jgi:hypothetical protein
MLAVVSTWWFLALTAGLAVGWRLWPDSNERSNDPPKRDDVPASQSGSRVVRGSGPGASVGRDGARTLISGEEDGPQAVAAAMILCSRTEQS